MTNSGVTTPGCSPGVTASPSSPAERRYVNTILGGPTYSDGVANTVHNIAEAQRISTEDLKAVIIGANQTSLLGRFIELDEVANGT